MARTRYTSAILFSFNFMTSETLKTKDISKAVQLREVRQEDLTIFFEHQKEPEANQMAGFSAKDPNDRKAFDEHWKRIDEDKTIIIRTVEARGLVLGYVASFFRLGNREVSYWLGKDYWGRGVCTKALEEFLTILSERPLHARVAETNPASLKVLKKCGFKILKHEMAYAFSHGSEIKEAILILE